MIVLTIGPQTVHQASQLPLTATIQIPHQTQTLPK